MSAPAYLDCAATMPVRPEVIALMGEALAATGNAGSSHAAGRAARARLEEARARVAALIGADPADVLFTSGATESNNLALLGHVRGLLSRRSAADRAPPHLVSARTEHKSVIDPLLRLEREGCTITWLDTDASGRVAPGTLAAALRPQTALVALMHANNETGIVHDIAALARICNAHGAALHVDAAQHAGKLPLDARALGVDFLSCTAHKLGGPQGVGALYVHPRRRGGMQPLQHGGGQERGLRSGTVPVHLAAGFGLAAQLAAAGMAAEADRQRALRARLWAGLAAITGVRLNGSPDGSLPGILNVAFPGVNGESLQAAIVEVAVSGGAACNSAAGEPSYVLRALGLDREAAESSLRFSFGHATAQADIDLAISAVQQACATLRGRSDAEATGWRWTGEAGRREHGTWVRFMLNAEGGAISRADFRAYGCPYTLKACEALSAALAGRPLADPGLGVAADWCGRFSIPEARLGRLIVVEDALHNALAAARNAGPEGRKISGNEESSPE